MLAFGRNSCRDVLNVLHQKADAFRGDPLNQELANQCAIDAWSLCDWVFEEHGQRLGFKKLGDFQSSMRTMCTSIEFLQDIANASKHKVITHYVPRLKEAKAHQGAFDRNMFSSVFDVSARSSAKVTL